MGEKGSETRLTETITYIKGHASDGFSPEAMRLIGLGLDTWKRIASQTNRDQLSGLMSQNGTTHRPGTKDGRAARRAAILLKCALVEPQNRWQETANFVNNSADSRALYGEAMKDARDAVFSDSGVANTKLLELKTQTETFLGAYPLRVNGKSQGVGMDYGFYMRDGIYRLDCYGPQNGIKVHAINVPAASYRDTVRGQAATITPTRSSVAPGCDLMLTTQFTGCCYCFQVNGAELAAAHIDPEGRATGITGQQVSADLRENGGFVNDNGGQFKAYGRIADGGGYGYPQSAQQMIIVGVRYGQQWRVYAQISSGTGLEVQRIDT